jgi:branched-chain amino acid transport system ATP-binding protein
MVQHLETVIANLRTEGLGILLVEQNLYSALAVADRVFVMETGEIVHQGSKHDMQADPNSLRRYLGVH